MSHPQDGDPSPSAPPPGALDPHWEAVLRAGQREDGGAGSVDAELAVVNLFRHAVSPEVLEPAAMDAVWAELAPDVTQTPWWKKLFDWRVVATAAAVAVAAAAAVVVVAWPGEGTPTPQPTEEIAAASPAMMGAQLETQFEILAPGARASLAKDVEQSRGSVRSELLSLATSQDKTIGGAP